MKEGRKPEYPEKIPGDELQKMTHTTHTSCVCVCPLLLVLLLMVMIIMNLYPLRRNVTTSMVGLKTATHARISPKMMNSRYLARERRRRRL